MPHSHHSHQHHLPKNQRILALSFTLIFSFMFVEWFAGFFTNSLALMADAGHMTNDAFSLGIAYFAVRLSQSKPKVAKILTLINGLSLLFVAIFIIIEAFQRLYHPAILKALPMAIVATLGLIVNIVVAKIMSQDHQDNLNMQAAYWHVLADLFGSIIAIFAGLCAYFLQWQWVDPLASGILSLVILRSGAQISYSAYQALRQ